MAKMVNKEICQNDYTKKKKYKQSNALFIRGYSADRNNMYSFDITLYANNVKNGFVEINYPFETNRMRQVYDWIILNLDKHNIKCTREYKMAIMAHLSDMFAELGKQN